LILVRLRCFDRAVVTDLSALELRQFKPIPVAPGKTLLCFHPTSASIAGRTLSGLVLSVSLARNGGGPLGEAW
jgi:hypothetical protein